MKSNKIDPGTFLGKIVLLTKMQQMKKTSIRLVLALAFSVLLLGACKKDKDDKPVGATKENLAGSYKLTKLDAMVPGTSPQNMLGTLEDCEKDDIYTLRADFTARYEDAGTKCDANGSNSYDTNWELDGNNITVHGGSYDFIGVIKSFDGKTLVIEGTYDYMGMSVKFEATLAKQ